MLKSLKATNFKKHKDLAVDFTGGLNVITGPNWQGKSSILHALLYGFFGVRAVPGGNAIIQNRDTTKHRVEVNWEQDGHLYCVVRTGSTSNLWKDGTETANLIATSTSSVNDKIEELLGMSREDFCRIMYAEQKHAEHVLTLGVTDLHKLIADVTRIETVTTVIGKCSDAVTRAELKLEVLPVLDTAAAQQGLETATATVDELQELEAELVASVTVAGTELTAAQETLRTTRETNAANREKLQRRTELLQEVSALNDKVSKLKDELAKPMQSLPSVDELKERKASLMAAATAGRAVQEAWKQFRRKRDDADKQLQQAKLAVEAAKRDWAACDQSLLAAVVPDIDAIKLAISEARVEVGTGKAEVKRLAAAVADAACPTCKRDYEGTDRSAIESALSTARTALTAAEAKLAAETSSLSAAEALDSRRDRVVACKDGVQTAEVFLYSAQASCALVLEAAPADDEVSDETMAQYVTEHNAVIEQEKQAALQAQALDHLRARITEAAAARATKLALLESLPPSLDVKPVDELVSQVNDLSRLKEARSEKLSSTRTSKAAAAVAVERHTATLKQAAAQKDERNNLTREIQVCKNLEKFLRQNKDSFVQEVWERITAYASFVAETCTSGAISRLVRTPDGKFEYHEEGNILPVEAASGAQRSILGLGVQLALADVLPCQLGTLMLDEPTADMSPEVSMSLAALLSQNSNQVIVISHRELDGLVAENSIAL